MYKTFAININGKFSSNWNSFFLKYYIELKCVFLGNFPKETCSVMSITVTVLGGLPFPVNIYNQ